MKSQDLLTITFTFVIGVVAGGYLFLIGFAPQFIAYTASTDNVYTDFSIDAKAYGGCTRFDSCSSFQIRNDGTFGYLRVGEAPISGTLPTAYMKELRSEAVSAILRADSHTVKPATCNSYIDGIDYHYSITLQSQIYELDTCGTALSSDTTLKQTLDKIWDYLQTI